MGLDFVKQNKTKTNKQKNKTHNTLLTTDSSSVKTLNIENITMVLY